MFSFDGDTIRFKGWRFAEISPVAWPTLRAEACDAIEQADEWDDLIEAHMDELNEEYRKGYSEAEEILGREIERLQDKIDDLEAKLCLT
jgi:phage shock protein A